MFYNKCCIKNKKGACFVMSDKQVKKGGRPKIPINRQDFEKLCTLQCTLEEVAGFFDCSHDTIERWCKRTYGETFGKVFNSKRSKGLISLRRAQFRMAEGNATMAIWLGKQYLNQKDLVVFDSRNEETPDPLTLSIQDVLNGDDDKETEE